MGSHCRRLPCYLSEDLLISATAATDGSEGQHLRITLPHSVANTLSCDESSEPVCSVTQQALITGNDRSKLNIKSHLDPYRRIFLRLLLFRCIATGRGDLSRALTIAET